MTRVVIGLDGKHDKPSIDFTRAMAFSPVSFYLIHVDQTSLPEVAPEIINEFKLLTENHDTNNQGNKILEEATHHFSGNEMVTTKLLSGNVSKSLLDYANEVQADVISVFCQEKKRWESLFAGSVTRALSTNATQSLAITKQYSKPKERLSAVFATDHSPYCDECVDKFIELNPTGIEKITVVSASKMDLSAVEYAVPHLPHDIEAILDSINERIKQRNETIANKLTRTGAKCDTVFYQDHPNIAIQDVMNKTSADLLIMGARGHGVWDRIRLGSVSHFHLVKTPYNLFIIRP
jgi:nucleotide-binding universal stress UspA family protein